MTELALGTVQFGMNYGITNKTGKVPINNIKEILATAKNEGINYIDTARAYGNAEKLIGEANNQTNKFKIISKIRMERLKKKKVQLGSVIKASMHILQAA